MGTHQVPPPTMVSPKGHRPSWQWLGPSPCWASQCQAVMTMVQRRVLHWHLCQQHLSKNACVLPCSAKCGVGYACGADSCWHNIGRSSFAHPLRHQDCAAPTGDCPTPYTVYLVCVCNSTLLLRKYLGLCIRLIPLCNACIPNKMSLLKGG